MTITIAVFKWRRIKTGFQLPFITNYTAEHVNKLYRGVQRNTTVPFRFVCVTDDAKDIDTSSIEVLPLFKESQYLMPYGGCYHRLFIFSKQVEKYLGPRFITIDLDCVITGSLDKILTRPEDFVMNQYDIKRNNHATHQYYNGGLILMTAGSREIIWNKFRRHPDAVIYDLDARKKRLEIIGSDQAVISHFLGPDEAIFTPENDGVYDYRKLPDRQVLPSDANMVFFAGKRDPYTLQRNHSWIRQHWL